MFKALSIKKINPSPDHLVLSLGALEQSPSLFFLVLLIDQLIDQTS